MKYSIIALILLNVFNVSCSETSDFIPLFNGKNLDGWEIKNGTAPFTVENEEIIGTYVGNTPNTFLCTKEKYADFILTFEGYLGEGTNSGVMFRAQSTPEYKNFAAAIKGKEKLVLGLKDAYQSAISVHMANDAIRNEKVVRWTPELDV